MPTEAEIAASLFAGLARAMRDDSAHKPRRRRGPTATRHQVIDAADQAARDGCMKTRLPDGSGYLVAPPDPKQAFAFDYPGRPLRVLVPYRARERVRVFEAGERGRPEVSRLVSNTAAIEALRLMAEGIREHREWTAGPSESCLCPFIASPPCSFCENCAECEQCDAFVLDLAAHTEDEHPESLPEGE